MGFEHKSVLLEETINGLNIRPDGTYVDGTLGGGGHAYEICRRLGDKGSIVGNRPGRGGYHCRRRPLKRLRGEGHDSQEQLL